MKRFVCYMLTAVLLLSLSACNEKPDITGTWEQQMETSVLGEGVAEPTSIESVCRFTFREDGTGIQEHIMMDEKYPDAVRKFTWKLDADILTLEYEAGHLEEFTIVLNKTTLKLENRRGSYNLAKQ